MTWQDVNKRKRRQREMAEERLEVSRVLRKYAERRAVSEYQEKLLKWLALPAALGIVNHWREQIVGFFVNLWR